MQSTFTTINQALKNNFHSVTSEEQKCIDDCLQCHAICEQLIPYCLDKGGMHAERIHLQKIWLCADTCRTCADSCLKMAVQHQ